MPLAADINKRTDAKKNDIYLFLTIKTPNGQILGIKEGKRCHKHRSINFIQWKSERAYPLKAITAV